MKKRLFLVLGIVLFLVILGIATSYALFSLDVTKNKIFKMAVGKLEISLNDNNSNNRFDQNGNAIIENLYPMKDNDGFELDGYAFTITNTGAMDAGYTIYLDDVVKDNMEVGRLNSNLIKLNFTNNTTHETTTLALSDLVDRVLETGTISKNTTYSYTLKIWLDYNAGNEAQNKYYGFKVRIDSVQKNSLCQLELNEEIDFSFDPDNDGQGQVQTYTVPCDGDYKLEVWGAQGGYNRDTDGKGGYTYGNITLTKGTILNVVVGGKGEEQNQGAQGAIANGGYNGGGKFTVGYPYSASWITGAGGGATHIALKDNNSTYSTLASYENATTASNYVIMVAGGGGGATWSMNIYSAGGTGGGTTGSNGVLGYNGNPGYGGTQSEGGTSNGATTVGLFGQGGNNTLEGGAGGGGWYGGSAALNSSSGGGGSGYTNTNMMIADTYGMSNGMQAGNGHARITYLGE